MAKKLAYHYAEQHSAITTVSISPPPAAAGQNPVDIAREAFRRLATRRIAPTPDAYKAIYDEIAGTPRLAKGKWSERKK